MGGPVDRRGRGDRQLDGHEMRRRFTQNRNTKLLRLRGKRNARSTVQVADSLQVTVAERAVLARR